MNSQQHYDRAEHCLQQYARQGAAASPDWLLEAAAHASLATFKKLVEQSELWGDDERV